MVFLNIEKESLLNVRIRDKSFKLDGKEIIKHKARTNIHDKFWGRKYKVNQHDICDYLKYWRAKSGWSTSRMSVRECALIQTFPLDFEFVGSLGNMYKQIGNAIPVLLAEKVAKEIKKELQKYDDQSINRKIREQVFE